MSKDGKTKTAGTFNMERSQTSACDLCGQEDFQTIAERDRKGRELKTVACRNCGLVSHASVPTDQELAAYYRRQYRRDYNNEYTPSARRVLREWKRGRRRFELLRQFLSMSDRVFEIGTGIGCNLKPFDLAGFEVAGIEPGEGFRAFARENLHLQVEGGVLADVPQNSRHDLVMLVHVLEHFNSPTTALRHIRGILNPGGRLYVEVPNLGAPHAAPGKLFHYAHIYNFTPTTLATAARASGFEVEKVLSDPRDKNLSMLLSAGNGFKLEVDRASYRKTVEAVTRFSTITYHLRWRYLRDRVLSVRDLFTGKFGAQKQLAELLELSNRTEDEKPHLWTSPESVNVKDSAPLPRRRAA
ncbi:MAG: class I SAM-dependent methyltransferase [Planctomycetes bacterium]|nr:class I SAM-dependent methyltransferase [Planctomycetota bacterium]